MAQETPLDRFKAVLGGTARALSEERELELAFTADAPSQAGKHVRVPMPARQLPADQVAEARGFADQFALRMRLHDAAVHQRGAPSEPVARAVYDAVENARVEALGSRGYAGISDNLETALGLRLRSDPITRARSKDEVPLSTALGLMVRERLTGRAPPASAAMGMALVKDWIEEKVGGDLDALGLATTRARKSKRPKRAMRAKSPEARARATSRRGASSSRTRTPKARASSKTREWTTPRASPATRATRGCSRSVPTGRSPIFRPASITKRGPLNSTRW